MKKILEHKKIIILIITILVCIGLLAVTYGYLKSTDFGQKENLIKIGKLNLLLEENAEGNVITIPNTIPILDEEGLASEGFTFSIENKDNITLGYTIYLDDIELDEGKERISDSAIRYSLDINEQKGEAKDLTEIGINPNRMLDTGILKTGIKNTYTLRLWIDYDATNEEASGKIFKAKLRVVAKQTDNT